MASNPTAKARNILFGRILGIEPREYVAVAWSFAYFFCVLSSYYILRPIREAMAVGSGPQTIPYLFLGTFTLMMIASPVFGWVTSRYPRRVFLPWVYLFFVFNILIFSFLFYFFQSSIKDDVWLGRAFFVWLSVFNLFVVSVFWSFMADIYSRSQARRLFGVITAGGSIGALAGSGLTNQLVTTIGFQNLFPIAALILLAAVPCIYNLRKWVVEESNSHSGGSAGSEKPLGGNPFAGITHVPGSRYFQGIVVNSVLASLLGTALYMFAAQLVSEEIPTDNQRVEFFSNIDFWVNFFALIGQLLLVRQVVGRFGIGRSLALMPFVSIIGFIALYFNPMLGIVAILTIARRALGFSFSKPTTDMLYSVVTPEEKYKTKNFIDTAVYRFGDIVGTWTVKFLLVFGINGVSLIMVPFAAIWMAISLWLGRDYKRQARELAEKGVA